MIKIYSVDDLIGRNWEIVDDWDFPMEEVDYLLEEHNNESFVLRGDRLYEIEVYDEK